jgi:hypothetical protein
MPKTAACTAKTTAAAAVLNPEMTNVITRTAVVTQAANRGPRTSIWAMVLVVDTELLLLRREEKADHNGCAERGPKGRGYSAATTTTRDAAQINCAALGEHGLQAG